MIRNPNLLLRDAMIRHAVYVQRYGGGVVKEVHALLDANQRELTQLLLGRLRPGGLTAANVERIRRLEESIRELRDGPWRSARTLLVDRAVDLAKAEPLFMQDALRRVSPVVIDTITPSASVLRQLVQDPIQGHSLAEWFSTTKQRDVRGIMGALRMGMVQSETVDQMVDRALVSTALSRNHAQTLVRTAINDISNSARQEFFEHNSELISEEQFVATLDGRTTPICMACDGKHYPVGEGPMPALHFNCRSIRVPVLDGQEISTRPAKATTERLLRAEYEAAGGKGSFREFSRKRVRQLTTVVPSNLGYNDWLKTQSTAFQNDVLGPTRAKLFRQGVSVDKFVNRAGDELTLSELRKRHADAFAAAGL